MLKYFLKNDLIRFCDKQPKNWQEAIQISCENLLEKEMISQVYVDEIITCVEKFGPYIVIVPGVAMPHSSEESEGVFGTGIAFTKMPQPVSFEEGNEEKDAILFFTLAAKNGDEHVQNIGKLSEMLMTEGLVEDLSEMGSLEDYQQIVDKYDL